jgi:predicted nucleotidyltransferase
MFNFLKNGTGQILKTFFKDPDKQLYVRELSKLLNKEPGYFQRILNNLVEEGVLVDERVANLRYFKLNKNYPLYLELKNIISKTLGIEAKLKNLVEDLENIKYAFIFGSIASGKEKGYSDIDLMLVGKVDQEILTEETFKLENELSRTINYHMYTKKEIRIKLQEKNDFIIKIFKDSKIILKGDIHEFIKSN